MWNLRIVTQFGDIYNSWHSTSLLNLVALRLHSQLYFCLCFTKSLTYCISEKIDLKQFFSNLNVYITCWWSSWSSDSASAGLGRGPRFYISNSSQVLRILVFDTVFCKHSDIRKPTPLKFTWFGTFLLFFFSNKYFLSTYSSVQHHIRCWLE